MYQYIKYLKNNIKMTTNKIGQNWMIRMDDNCAPNKSSHSPACDMRGLMSNGSVGDLLWFICKGRIVAVATFASATSDKVSYNTFYDLSDCDFHPAIPILNETVSSYYEQKTWQWGAYVEYVYICRYRKITE